MAAAAREFAPDGLDAALVTAGGETAERALAAVRDGGRVAYPNGVMPEPKARPGVRLSSYDVIPGQEATDKLNRLIDSGPFEIHVARRSRSTKPPRRTGRWAPTSSASSPCGRVEYGLHQT